MLGAVCHDFGKPATTAFIDGRIRSIDHEEQGVAPATAFLDRLNVHSIDGYDVRAAGARHHRAAPEARHVVQGRATRSATARSGGSRRRWTSSCWRGSRSRTASGASPGVFNCEAMDWFLERARALGVEHRPPGADPARPAPAGAGSSPGPRVGEILKAVYEQQLDGTVTTLDEAIELQALKHVEH